MDESIEIEDHSLFVIHFLIDWANQDIYEENHEDTWT